MRTRHSVRGLAALLVLACHGPGPGASRTFVAPEPGERHLENIRQLTFGGNNAESYFSRSGKQLIFQRQEKVDAGCDQEYIMNIDGSGMRRISNGLGRTTCGYFYDNDRRVLYSSTFKHAPACPAPPDRSHGYVWPLGHLEIYTSKPDGSDLRQLTDNGAYNAEATVSPDGKTDHLHQHPGRGHRPVHDEYRRHRRSPDHQPGRVRRRGVLLPRRQADRLARGLSRRPRADTADYLGLLAQRLVRPAKVEVWVANADGSNARQITHLGGANFAPFFTPDGKRIIFSSNYENPRSGEFDLFLINLDGTGLEKVTTHPDFDCFPMFSPDGKKLVWASNRNQQKPGETNLFIADWVE